MPPSDPASNSELAFNPYELDVSLYEEDLAAYALGRLFQRLRWHYEQWLCLTAELTCSHNQPESDARFSAIVTPPLASSTHNDEYIDWADDHDDASEDTDGLRQEFVRFETQLKREKRIEKDLAVKVSNQLPGIVLRLRSAASHQLRHKLESFVAELFDLADLDFDESVQELQQELTLHESDEDYDRIRKDILWTKILRRGCRGIAKAESEILNVLSDNEKNMFWVGLYLEQLLCPNNIFHQMTFSNPEDIVSSSGISLPPTAATRFPIACCVFDPGSIWITKLALAKFRTSLQSADLLGIVASLLPKVEECTNRLSNPLISDQKLPRFASYPRIVEVVGTIHQAIVANEGTALTAAAEATDATPIEGVYGERLVPVSEDEATLIRNGKQAIIGGSFTISLLGRLIRARGCLCPFSQLGCDRPGDGRARNKLQQMVRRLNVALRFVGLNAASVWGKGLLRAVQNGGGGRPKMVALG